MNIELELINHVNETDFSRVELIAFVLNDRALFNARVNELRKQKYEFIRVPVLIAGQDDAYLFAVMGLE